MIEAVSEIVCTDSARSLHIEIEAAHYPAPYELLEDASRNVATMTSGAVLRERNHKDPIGVKFRLDNHAERIRMCFQSEREGWLPRTMQPSAAQFRAARALLNWSKLDLAQAARASVSAVLRAENKPSRGPSDGGHDGIRSALEAEGIVFLDDRGATGVLLRLV